MTAEPSFKYARRGRPSAKDKEEMQRRIASFHESRVDKRSDEEIMSDLTTRFDLLGRLTASCADGLTTSFVATGSPGVGKTHTIHKVLTERNASYSSFTGTISAINIYMQAYERRNRGNVLVFDDADDIFEREDAMNILKALCDTTEERTVTYLREAKELKEKNEVEIPQQFIFNGSVIIVSNKDFQRHIDEGNSKMIPHYEALMSRSMYLDLRLHSRREIGTWVEHVTQSARLLDIYGTDSVHHGAVLQFIRSHRETFRELSIRTVKKLCSLVNANPTGWESDAKILLIR